MRTRGTDQTKKLVDKLKNPKKSKTKKVRMTAVDKLAKKVGLIVESAKSMLTDDGSTELITDERRLREYMRAVRENGILAIDTETTGLDPIDDKLVGVSLCTIGAKGAYVPLNHTDISGNKLTNQIDAASLKDELSELAGVKLLFHNAKFDIRVLRNHLLGFYLSPHWDSSLASNFLNENEPHSLKYLWDKYINRQIDQKSESFSKLFENVSFNYIPLDIAKLYAGKDGIMTLDLYLFQQQYLNPESPHCEKKGLTDAAALLRDVEIPLISVLAEMEDTGVEIDKDFASELSERYTAMMEEVQTRIQKALKKLDYAKLPEELRSKLGDPINLNSPKQLSIIFYDLLGLKSPDPKNPRGTGEEILEVMAERYKRHKKLFHDILEYRGLKKLIGTYIDKLPAVAKGITVHGSFNQYGARTGRMSSSDPNLQNIPSKNKEIRRMFVAPEGYVMLSGDFSQQEPRVLAHISGDDGLINAYKTGKDLYSWMASMIYAVPYDECKEFRPDGTKNPAGEKRRNDVKSIVLGLLYGRGVKSIAEQIGASKQEAQKFMDIFFSTFPKIKQTIDTFTLHAKQYGYVSTVWGRKRRLPDINLPDYEFYKLTGDPVEDAMAEYLAHKLRKAHFLKKQDLKDYFLDEMKIKTIDNGGKIAEAHRQVLNSIIQGTAADITKIAMLYIGQSQELRQLGAKMILTVHDEIIMIAPKENAKKAAEMMVELMIKSAYLISVPMKVDVSITARWYGEEVAV